VFYVFHGDDEFGQAEELAGLRRKLAVGEPAMADLNTSILDGSHLSLDELRHVCDSIPFMAERRLVIVHGLLSRLVPGRKAKGQESAQDEEPAWRRSLLRDLAEYLPALPPTTRLIFVEDKTLPASHAILQVAKEEGRSQKAFVKLFAKPKDSELPGWIERRVRSKGGTISHEAAMALSELVGSDLRLLDQEIEKLLLYADGRQVNSDDVRALVSQAREASMFDLVDCVGRRQTDRALNLLHHLLDDGEAPLYLLAMLARQIRILIQVSELRATGLSQPEIVGRLKLHPYVVEKGLAQAGNFNMAQLEAAHQRLVDADWSIKTGRIDEILALDLLVTDLTRA
jgi:DNA polymerase III subunit delta